MTIDQVVEDFSVATIARYLTAGGDVNLRWGYRNWTLVHYAAELGDSTVIDFLSRQGAELDCGDKQGATALHVAVDSDIDTAALEGLTTTLPTVRTLIDSHATEDLLDVRGGTARDVAAAYGQKSLDLYDSISRLSRVGEPTIASFAATCKSVLDAVGYSVKILDDQHQLSVAEDAADHDRFEHRFFLSAGYLYARRRDATFGDSLVASVREGFEKLRARRAI